MEKLFPIDYLSIQLDFAQRATELTGIGLYRALRTYTSIGRMANLPHSTPDTHPFMTEMQQLVSATKYGHLLGKLYYQYTEYALNPFPKEDRLNSGHFQLSIPDDEEVCHVHFESKTSSNPLRSENLGQRRQELIQLFQILKDSKHAKVVKNIGGFSWLYNLKAYCSLFPPDYVASGKEKDWYGSLARWGQFLNNNYTMRENITKEFKQNVSDAQAVDDLKTSFRFSVLETRAPVELFYNFYRI